MTRYGNTDYLLHDNCMKSIFCLHLKVTLTYALPRNTKYLIDHRWPGLFTDSFLPMLLNHEGTFLGPEGTDRSAWVSTSPNRGLPFGLHQFMSHTEGTALLFESKWCFTPSSAPHLPPPPPTNSLYRLNL